MAKFRSTWLSVFFAAMYSVGIFVPAQRATAVDAQTAGIAKMIGGVLLMHGAYSLYKDVGGYMRASNFVAANCTNPLTAPAGCPPATADKTYYGKKIPFDLLEVAGGAAAMMINGESENDMKDAGYTPPETSPSGGSPGGGLPGGGDVFDTCKSMPEVCSINPNTNKPQLTMPPKEIMQAAVRDSFTGQAVNPEGLSLDEALADLDDKYGQAEAAVAAFNRAAETGAFGGSGDSMLAGTGQGEGDPGDGEGLNKGGGLSPGSSAALDNFTLPNGQTMDWNALLNKNKNERGDPSTVKAVGMNLEDAKTGRLLTLFERVSRTLRGTRNRDILLAKVEWTRKEALKRMPASQPKMAVSTEKN